MAGEINFGAIDSNAPYTGMAHTNSLLTAFAKLRAGQALARGDTEGAVQGLNNSGEIDAANTVRQNDWTQHEHMRNLSAEQQADSAKFVVEVSSALYRVKQEHAKDPDRGVGATLAGFDQLAPILQQRGRKPEEIAMLRTQLAQDPERFLTLMHDNAVKHYVTLKGGTGSADRLINTDTGATIAQGAPAGPQVKIVHDADGAQHIVQIDPEAPTADAGNTAAPGAPVGPAGSAPPAPPTGAAPVTVEQSAGANAAVEAATAGNTPAATPWATPQTEIESVLGAPISVSAHGYDRTPAENAAAGGVSNSEHVPASGELHGHAIDFNAKGMSRRAAMQKIVDAGIPFNQMIDEGDHVHISWGSALKGQILEGNRTKGYRPLSMAPSAAPVASSAPVSPEVTPQTVTPAAGRVTELWAGSHTAKPGPTWEVKSGGPFAAGTVYKVERATGNTVVLQASPKAPAATNKPLPANEEKTLYDLRKSVNERRNVDGLLTEFVGYLKGANAVKTGGMMGMTGVATALGPFNTKVGRMRAIINQLTPVMRNGLPGAASDRDVAMFRGATVGFDKTDKANILIADAGHAMLKREGDYLAFLEAYANQHRTLNGATEVWQTYTTGNPLFVSGGDGVPRPARVRPWRDAIKLDDTPSTPAPKGRTWTPDKGLH